MNQKRLYETTFIINAALDDSDIEAVINKVISYIENNGGEITETNKWGRRRLAYPINKKYNGYYVHLVFETKPSAVPILERFLVLEDTVLRHLTLILPIKLRDYRAKVALEQGRTYDSTIYDVDHKLEAKENQKSEAKAEVEEVKVDDKQEVKVNEQEAIA
ncbi:MAG TPA: 30S ribosomal protein S6 [Candidatus Kapabacteria bacterium]|nr:30S ribosomal protein S6 [Candidatus Kapabacteria bacterium]